MHVALGVKIMLLGTSFATRLLTDKLREEEANLVSIVLLFELSLVEGRTAEERGGREKPQKIPWKNCYYLFSFSLSGNNRGLMGVRGIAGITAHSHDTIFTVF